MANLPESYLDWLRQFGNDDKFAYECINMGAPLGTATAINRSVIGLLELACRTNRVPSGPGYRAPVAQPISLAPISLRILLLGARLHLA